VVGCGAAVADLAEARYPPVVVASRCWTPHPILPEELNMTVVMPTKVTYESLPGDNCGKWTIEVQRWDNIVDRPADRPPRAADLPEEVRDAIREWLDNSRYDY
jgi:hypothetical protein